MNVKSGLKREILDKVPTKISVQWYWIEDGNKKQAYGLDDIKKMEHAYKDKQPCIDLIIKRHKDDLDNKYRIDFGKMLQINQNTGYIRPIKREEIQMPEEVSSDSEGDFEDNICLDESKITYKVWFVGMANLKMALIELDNRLSSMTCVEKIDNQNLADLVEDELKRNGFWETNKYEWIKNGVDIKQNGNSIELKGRIKKDVKEVKEELFRLFLSQNSIEYPQYWDVSKNKSDKFCELIDVFRGSTEWSQIETEFKATLPASEITVIQKIQNTRIYKYYYEEKTYLLKKNKKSKVNEIYLWHGTRNVSPDKIYSSDKCGLDFHHSAEGLWGRGIYLAKNASYSYTYSHLLPDGQRQMLFCSVLVGESVKLDRNNSLRLPPIKDEASSERYDSVEGATNGSQIFIVYDNQKDYPAYLVTFK